MKNQQKNSRRLREIGAIAALVCGTALIAAPVFAADTNVNLTAANAFDTPNVTIVAGDTVTFTWQGGFHDVVFADGVKSGSPVGIDGTTWSRTFDTAGSYAFICSVHESSGMKGTVTVQAAAGGGSATTTTAAGGGSATTTTAAGGGSATTTTAGGSGMPFTGPEDSLLPVFGIGLIVVGTALRLRLRRAK